LVFWEHQTCGMSITPEVPAKTLMQMVATRIRVAMAVEDIRQSELARRMGKNEQWLSVRLRGKQAIDLNDLLMIAKALGVGIHDLLPDADQAAGAADPSAIPRYLPQAIRAGESPLAEDNRPPGHPSSRRELAAAATGVRTGYVTRRPRGRRD
jgi:transcriptional regulator with XRE-family HTH domain